MLFSRSNLLSNSIWGLISSLFQTLFLSLFFVILSRNYGLEDFSNFLVANTVYQLIIGISTMGLGHWFVREYDIKVAERLNLTQQFIKIQGLLGVAFYLINIIIAFLIYQDAEIRLLAIIFGTNIIFDNIIYAVKNLNVAEMQQKKTAVILALDGLFRLAASCILFFYPIPLILLSVLLVIVRLITVNLFLQIGSKGKIDLIPLLNLKVSATDFKNNVLLNWKFVLIVGSAILFWRSATIIISKVLTDHDVANYEIAYKIFSIFTMLAIVASTTVYPKLVKYSNSNEYKNVAEFYRIVFAAFSIFSVSVYAFIQSYIDLIIPFVFGKEYLDAIECAKQMFLTFLLFPTVFLQANLLVAMKKEKIDMILNIIVLILNLAGCLIGLHFFKTLAVVNYSIFGSFLVFHVVQSVFLIKMRISSLKTTLAFYVCLGGFVPLFGYLTEHYHPTLIFLAFMLLVCAPLLFVLSKTVRKFGKIELKQTSDPVLVEV